MARLATFLDGFAPVRYRFPMTGVLLLGATLAIVSGAGAHGEPLSVPNGHSVTVDGSFGDAEWTDAASRDLPGGIELLVKADAVSLYLALRFTETKHSGLDLYLASPGGTRRLFHISSDLGTKTWEDGAWGEYEWNPVGWSGNVIGFERTEEGLVIFEPDGFELRLDRDMLEDVGLGGETLRMSFRLKRPELTVPPDAAEAPLGDWPVLRLAALPQG